MKSPKEFLTSLSLIAAIVITISALWQDNLLTTTVLACILAITLMLWHTREDIIHLFIAVLVGPSMEAVCVYFGAWSYSNPNLLIPVWLPLCWGLAGIILPRIAKCFNTGGPA
jgi:uncharacterized membrane protein YoaT (DUF817 family)